MTKENNPNQPANPHALLYFMLARAFWLAFNHLSMYGPEHPLGRQAVQDCRRRLLDVLTEMPHVTLHLERGGLFCNQLRIDRELRLERLSDRLSQAGIEALTFTPGVTDQELLLLFSMLVNSKEYRGLAEIRTALPEKHVFYNRLIQRAREKVFVADSGAAESGELLQSGSGPVPLALDQQPATAAETAEPTTGTAGLESSGSLEPVPATGLKKRLKAPRGMLSARETKAVVEAEIYRAGRYEVPYSVITFSLEGKRTGLHGKTAVLEDQEFMLALQLLTDELKLLLRHLLDRIGTLAPVRRNQFLLSLPMTPISGAHLLMERLEKKYSEWIISRGREVLLPVLIFSTFTFSFKKPPGVSLFIRQIKRRHGQKKKIMAEQGLI